MLRSASPTPISKVPRTLNGLPPHRSAKGPVKGCPNQPGKGDGTDATELLISQPGPPAKIHPEGSQEYWHEIYRDSETHHPRIAKSQGMCGIECAVLHGVVPETSWSGRCQTEVLAREIQ